MTKLKILHSADWHICDEFLEDAKRCLAHLVERAKADEPGIIVISGDIYNHRQIRQEASSAWLAFDTLSKLSNIAPVIVLLGTPSHDGRAPILLNVLSERYPVWVETNPSQIKAWASPQGEVIISNRSKVHNPNFHPFAIISCVPAFTKQFFQQDQADIESTDIAIAGELGSIFAQFGSLASEINRQRRYDTNAAPLPHILMGHWSIGGAYVHPAQGLTGLDIEVARDYVELAQADIVCMGHIHAEQKIGKTIYYPGSLFATDFGEVEQKGFYVHTLELVDMANHWEITESEFVPTPSPKLVKLTSDMLALSDQRGVEVMMETKLKGLEPDPNAVIRYEIMIYQDLAHAIDVAKFKALVMETLKPRSFDIEIARLPRPNVRSAKVLEVETLRDKLTARSEIIGEPLAETVLEKADILEALDHENVLDAVQKGVN